MRRIYKQIAALLLVSILMNEGAIVTYAETVSDNTVTENIETISENTVIEDIVTEDIVTEDIVTEDIVTENTVSEDTASENVIPEQNTIPGQDVDDSVSVNGVKTGKTIVVDGVTYELFRGEVVTDVLEEAHGEAAEYANRFFSFDARDKSEYYRKYYNQISEDAKVFYHALEEHMDDMKSGTYVLEGTVTRELDDSFSLSPDAFEEFKAGYAAFDYDHPECFWVWANYVGMSAHKNYYLDGNNVQHCAGYTVSLSVRTGYEDYLVPVYDNANEINADISEMEQNISAVSTEVSKKKMIYEKLAVMNDWLVDNNYYNHFLGNVANTEMSKAWESSSALTEQTPLLSASWAESDPNSPVCEGYSRAFKVLCDEVGIPCIVVSGNNHMWNYIQNASGVWYAVDTTWNDPYDNELYGAMTTEEKRLYLAVGSATVLNGETFIAEHPTNGVFWVGGDPFAVPTLSTEVMPQEEDLTLQSVSINDIPESAAEAVSVNKIQRGKTYQLGVTFDPVNTEDDTTVTWTSSDEDVIEVDTAGMLTAVSVGNATITATAGDADNRHSDTIEITVCYPVGWFNVSGNKFYGDENGDIIYGWQTINGKTYYFDPDTGIMQTGVVTIEGIKQEFGTDGVYIGEVPDNGFATIDGLIYYYRDGNKVLNEMIEQDNKYYYLDATGVLQSGWITYQDNTYYANETGVIQTGLCIVEGVYYYFSETDLIGTMQEGLIYIDGNPYIFGSTGELQTGYFTYGESNYYSDSSGAQKGVLKNGWVQIDEVWHIFDDETYAEVVSQGGSQWVVTGGKRYYLKDNKIFLSGWQSIDGNRYFFEDAGYVKTGFYTEGNKTYFLDANGVMLTGEQMLTAGELVTAEQEGDYDFGTDGVMRYGWQKSETTWKYYDPVSGLDRGAEKKGYNWYQLDGSRFYFKDHKTLATGWQTIEGNKYYFEPEESDDYHQGEMRTGLVTIGGKQYFLNDYMMTGLFTHYVNDTDYHTYYANTNGVLQLGWQKVEGIWRYFDRIMGYEVSAAIAMDYWATIEDTDGKEHRYYFKDGTSMVTGLQTIDGKSYYFSKNSEDGSLGQLQIGFISDGKNIYYADAEGVLQSGIVNIEAADEAGTYYFSDKYIMQTGWQRVNGAWHYFATLSDAETDATTFMGREDTTVRSLDGYWYTKGTEDNTKYFYFKNAVTLLKGWQTIAISKYYFDPLTGAMCVGLTQLGKNYYYFEPDTSSEYYGTMQTGLTDGCYYGTSGYRLTGWQTINKQKYYFDPVTGVCQKGILTIGTKKYICDMQGVLKTGLVTLTMEEGFEVGEVGTYYLDTSGVMQFGWQKVNDIWMFFDYASGKKQEMSSNENYFVRLENGETYYFANGTKMLTGFQLIDGKQYYFSENKVDGTFGQMKKGFFEVGQKHYYADADGVLQRGVIEISGETYYFSDQYVMCMGWQQISGYLRYFDLSSGQELPVVNQGFGYYRVTVNGTDNTYYFLNGKLQTGWKVIDQKRYYFDSNGVMQTGVFSLGKITYYANTDQDSGTLGSMYTGLKENLVVAGIRGNYYFNENGQMQTGWQQIGQNTYYFSPATGAMQYGQIQVGKYWYYLNEDGARQSGFITNNGNTYYCSEKNGTMAIGWLKVNGVKYYFDETGILQTGFLMVGKEIYYLEPVAGAYQKGEMRTGIVQITGQEEGTYYFNSAGIMQTGWKQVNGIWRYFATKQDTANSEVILGKEYSVVGGAQSNWVQVTMGGETYDYYFMNGKTLATGWKTVDGTKYYFDPISGAKQTGFITVGTKNYYLNDDGSIYTGFREADGAVYYHAADGLMVTGWQTLTVEGIKGKYYFGTDGKRAEGFWQIGKSTYYFEENPSDEQIRQGMMKTGLIEIADGENAGKYLLNATGAMLTGWQSVKEAGVNYKRYFDPNEGGRMSYGDELGMIQIGEKRYRVDPDTGNPIVGLLASSDGKTYYSDAKGLIQTGWKTISQNKYYFDSISGAMYIGLNKIGTDWYFFDETTGIMQIGSVDSYLFSSKGIRQYGWQKVGSAWRYYDLNTGIENTNVTRNGNWVTVTFGTAPYVYERQYYFDKGTTLVKNGWKTVPGPESGEKKSFYFNQYGELQKGTFAVNGVRYFTMPDGEGGNDPGSIYTGFIQLNGNWNYYDAKGKMKTGWMYLTDAGVKKSYYFNSNGMLCTGKTSIKNAYYYFSSDGTIPGADDMGILQTGEIDAGTGNRYYADTKGILKNGWQYVNGVWKYYDLKSFKELPYTSPSDGWATATIDGVVYRYYFKDNKQLVKGKQTIAGYSYYFDTATGALLTGEFSIGATRYNTDPVTGEIRSAGFIQSEDGTWKYFDKNGKMVTGWITIGTDKYYMDHNGTRLSGLFYVGKTRYYADEDGVMQTGFQTLSTGTYYFDAKGVMQTGWKTLTVNGVKNKYYFGADGRMYRDGIYEISGKQYCFDQDGILLVGQVTTNGATYNLSSSGVVQYGWFLIGNTWRYFGADGKEVLQPDVVPPTAENQWASVTIEGKKQVYYFINNKTLAKGWVDGYYFDGEGVLQTGDAAGILNIKSFFFHVDPDNGAVIEGLCSITGSEYLSDGKYCFDSNGKMITGWKIVSGEKYYFTSDGLMVSGATFINGKYYLFDENGILQMNCVVPTPTQESYYTDKDGVIYTGWQRVNGTWRYYDIVTGREETAVISDGNWRTLTCERGTERYYFADGTKMVVGWRTIIDPDTGISNRYYFNAKGVLQTGEFVIGNARYRADIDGTVYVNSWYSDIAGKKYYYDQNGALQIGWQTIDGNQYYFDVDGKALTGFQTIAQKKYYFNEDGMLQKSQIMVIHEDETDYYLTDSKGVFLFGWQKNEGNWQYYNLTDGKRQTSNRLYASDYWYEVDEADGSTSIYYFLKGTVPAKKWQTIAGKRYYFDPSTGIMQTGFVMIDNQEYFFNADGVLSTGIVNHNGTILYLTATGVVQKGWFEVNGKKCYANEITGELYTGFRVIDGVRYYFSERQATLGELQTGFFKIPNLGQTYYDKAQYATNVYYAHDNGAVIDGGWQVIKKEENVVNAQQWSFYFEPDENSPYYGEMIKGEPQVINGITYGVVTLDSKDYLFDYSTGARHKIVLYLHGGYYGKPINDLQVNVMDSVSKYINTDMKFETKTSDLIMATAGGEDDPYPAANYPLAASSYVEDERVLNEYESNTIYVAENDIMAYDSATGMITAGKDGAVDVCDVEAYCWDIYQDTIRTYGAENVVLVGASSGGGIALALLQKAAATTRDTNPSNDILQAADTVLLSPSLSAAMDHDTPVLGVDLTQNSDYDTFKYWGARYTRDARYTEIDENENAIQKYAEHPGPGVHYAFATPVDQSFEGLRNISIYIGSYDNCYNDCLLAKQKGGDIVTLRSYPRMTHGYMFGNTAAADETIREMAWIIMMENNVE